jgi:ATP-dependent DNA helicase RecQ
LLFTASSSELLDLVYDNERQENVLLFILRNYPNIHEFETAINLDFISEQTSENTSYITECILYWQSLNLCRFTPEENDITVTFNESWEGERTIFRILPYLEQQNKLKINQYKSMLFYLENEDICKNRILLKYFDEIKEEDCGVCSVCVSKTKKIQSTKNLKELKEKILSYLIRTPASISDLESLGISSKDDITTGIQILLEEGAIIVNFKNQYIIK